jgi:uncharacterized protein
MVSVNVAQLLQHLPGTVREFEFDEPLPDPNDDLRLRGPVRGYARLTRTSRGILVHADHQAPVSLDCARCLNEVTLNLEGSLDEEFVPTTDVRTGAPAPDQPEEPDQPVIDERHELNLDEVLRQNILTNLPLQPLCDTVCPGLCATCGRRLDNQHTPHPVEPIAPPPTAEASPFARLAELLVDDAERKN